MKLKTESEHTIIIEKSKFITYLNRIEDEDDAKKYILRIKKMHPDATHHCTAFVCHENNILQRSNDNGEPKGTAGAPMLNVLNKYGIENTVAVVVRYFGGIKLGAGGLIRAYSTSVSQALDAAAKTESFTFSRYRISVPYELNNKIDYYLRNNAETFTVEYDIDCRYTFLSDSKDVEADLSEMTSGRFLPEYLEDVIVEKDI